ncbi:uncharacterized protein LOC111386240 [Olea europaea var. sylvestris]|uniref:uncharacterized protein LOC111386240 n=1 Tax=Olea europaea var. sylvestris TaxID=158386 RepID=UPI000C1D230D|nr:uncharacterized protein LOC111386240 [Olea europaea var. sylvestris]
MARRQQDQATMFRDLLRAVQDLGRQQAQATPHNATGGANTMSSIVEQFRRFKPPSLDGRGDPFAAEEWLRRLEGIFEHMNCNDAQKVSCAKFMLTDDAGHWWEFETRTRTTKQQRNLTWNQFKESLMGKYFPQSLKDQKEVEFLQLTQGNLPLGEYERKFERLSSYAPHTVNTELTKAKRFEMGLRPEIKGIMAAQQYTTYAEVVRRAQVISNGLGLEKKTQPSTESSIKRKWQGHDKEKECLEKKREGDQLKKGKARVFALTGEKEDQNTDIGREFVKMNNILEVNTPSGEVVNTNQMVKDVKLEIEGKVLKADLYLLRMKDFDVILGMDWLGRNYSTILCHKKEVLFQKPGEKNLRFFGTKIGTLPRLVSAMKAQKMLRKNTCQGFLLNIISKPTFFQSR